MKNSVFAPILVSCGYAASVIGAGFASGQEIVGFFVKYGKNGILGIFIACIAFAVFSYAVLGFCTERGVRGYSDFLSYIFENTFFRRIAEMCVFVCAAVSMCVMTACSGEIGNTVFGAYNIIGATVFITVCGMVLFMEARSIMELNSFMGLLIVMGVIFTCFYILRFREHQTFYPRLRAAVSGISYAGYNVIGSGAVLAGMSRFLKDRNDALISSAASGIILFVMITLMWGVLGIYYGKIDLGEIPMLTMALRQNGTLGMFYGFMLIMAVLSTGISNGFALIDMMRNRLGREKAIPAVMLCALAVSGAGFGTLVNTVYRFCGYIGAIVAGMIIILNFINKKIKET